MDRAELASFVPTWLTGALDAAGPGARPVPLRGAVLFADISGFTALTNTLAERHGSAGAERLSLALNRFFALLIGQVRASGGHVASFAGDGLLACFPSERDDLAEVTLAAAQAGLEMTEAVGRIGEIEGVSVGLHTAVSAGDAVGVALGGHQGRWQTAVLGPPVLQLRAMFAGSQRGWSVLSPEAAALLAGSIEARELDQDRQLLTRTLRAARRRVTPADAAPGDFEPWLPDAIRARGEAPLGAWMAEIRAITSLFVSFADVQGAAEHPETLCQAVRVIQEELDAFHGTLHQISVDEKGLTASCAFGLPRPDADRPGASAARCAVEIRERLDALGLQAGLGLATGRVFVGPVGDGYRRELALVGPTIIRAARLAATNAGVMADGATRDLARDGVTFTDGPSTLFRGMAAPTPTWLAVRGRRRTFSPDERDDLVGRPLAMASLDGALAAHRSGEDVVAVLEGPAGIGKSRLAAYLVARARQAMVPVLEAVGDLAGVDRPYHAWRSALEHRLDLEEHASADVRARAAVDALAAIPGAAGRAPLLAPLLGIVTQETPETAGLLGPGRVEATAELVAALLARSAGPAGLLVVVDDAQWLDSASTQVLGALRRAVHPSLVVLTIRTGARAAPDQLLELASAPTARRVQVDPLGPAEVERLVGLRLGVEAVPRDLARWVVDRTEGNPYFVREVTASLVGGGLIEVRDGRVVRAPTSAELDAASPPASVEAIVTRRIDALPVPAQLAVKSASVLGMRFDADALRAVHPLGDGAVDGALAALEEASLCARRDDGLYQFGHRITLDVAYGQMVTDQRRKLHAAAGAWLEARSPDDASRLAWHWEHAGDAGRALKWLEAAWQDADRAGALTESHAIALRAAALLGADAVGAATWWRRMGDASAHLALYPRAIEESRTALAALGRPLPSTPRGWRVRLFGALLSQVAHRALPRALWARGGVADAEAALALTRAAEGFYFIHGDRVVALTCFLDSANAGERAGIVGRIPNSFGVLGLALTAMGLPRIGRFYLDVALREARVVGDDRCVASALFHNASAVSTLGRWDEAEALFGQARALCETSGNGFLLNFVLAALALNAVVSGRYRRAADYGASLLAISLRHRHERGEAMARATLAVIALAQGDADGAIAEAGPARQLLLRQKDLGWAMPAGTLARAEARLGRVGPAVAIARDIRDALRDVRPSDYRRLEGFAAPAEVLIAVGGQPEADVDDALALLHGFARIYAVGWARYHLLRGLALRARGQPEAAEVALHKALAEALARDLALDAARARLALGGPNEADVESARRWLRAEGLVGVAA